MSIRRCNTCCKRWYVTFDGQECNAPLPIDGTVYLYMGKDTQILHRPRVVRGHCNLPKAGKVNVEFRIGDCRGYPGGDALTGWQSSTSRIYIEEVNPPQV